MSSCFRFKSFTVYHDKCGMKVGTDAILLGAWAAAAAPKRILDIGSGTGIIALMLAQRFPTATIDAVEIEPNAFQQAMSNFQDSPWPDRLHIEQTAVQDYRPPQLYDLITCNPPYFREGPGAGTPPRHLARHDDRLSLQELMSTAARLLTCNGDLCVIIPTELSDEAHGVAASHHLQLIRRCLVKPTPRHPPKRHLLQFSPAHRNSRTVDEELTIELQRHHYSPEYTQLAKDFLLKL